MYQLNESAGWTSWKDQLDGPVLFTWSLEQFEYSKINISVCTLSQLRVRWRPCLFLYFFFFLFFLFLFCFYYFPCFYFLDFFLISFLLLFYFITFVFNFFIKRIHQNLTLMLRSLIYKWSVQSLRRSYVEVPLGLKF